MRILRQSDSGTWEYFGEGNSLQEMADLAGEPVNRYAFHIEDAKQSKKAQFANRMHTENRKLYPELDAAPGAWVAEMMLDIISEPRGTRVSAIKANKDRRIRGYAAIDAKAADHGISSEVLALRWEDL